MATLTNNMVILMLVVHHAIMITVVEVRVIFDLLHLTPSFVLKIYIPATLTSSLFASLNVPPLQDNITTATVQELMDILMVPMDTVTMAKHAIIIMAGVVTHTVMVVVMVINMVEPHMVIHTMVPLAMAMGIPLTLKR